MSDNPASSSLAPGATPAAPAAWPVGGGEMGERIRAFDWSSTPLGAPEGWPQNLKSAIALALGSRFPTVIWWGREALIQFYNDGYISFLGSTKHPVFLGRSGRECWTEIWETMGPLWDKVFATGKADWFEDFLYVINRTLRQEEIYVTFSYGAIRGQSDTVDGIFCSCYETTSKVVGRRRLQTLSRLAEQAMETDSVVEACARAEAVLAENRHDIPFARIHLLDANGALPVDAIAPDGLASALQNRRPAEVGGLELPGGPWPEPATQAVVLPLFLSTHDTVAGLIVLGVSPRRPLDAEYRTFFDLVAGHVSTAMANASSRQEERRRAEALAEINRAKTIFFSNISHEFRTPLTLMMGPLEEELKTASAGNERLELAHRNSLRLLKLVNNLLDFSRIEAGRSDAAYEPTDLAAYTADLASVFRAAVEQAGLRLVVDCPPLTEPVFVDREMWEKIVLNLLSNAFKFTLDGAITVTLRARDSRVELAVSDTGAGIPAAELPRLFERFHRVRETRARTMEGTGIGLALVQELVRLHGGTIGVDSTEGRGTTFTVALPTGRAHLPPERVGAARALAPTGVGAMPYLEEALRWLPAQPASPAAGQQSLAPGGSDGLATPPPGAARVVLADDNSDMRHYVGRLLAPHYAVEAVADGQAALEAAWDRPPDLVLADVMMPGLDGFALLQRLRADPRTSTIPVVLLSARAGEEARIEGLQAGADEYLIKPFSARELLAVVAAHVGLSRARQEAAGIERGLRAEAERGRAALQESEARLRAANAELQQRIAQEQTANAALREARRAAVNLMQDAVSSRERAEQAAADLRQAQAIAHLGSWQWDAKTDVITGCDELLRIYGFDPATQTMPDFKEQRGRCYPVEEWERINAAAQRALQTGVGYALDVRAFRSGTPIWVTTRSEVVRHAAGQIVGLRGTVQDITARKQAEAALKESARQHRVLAEVGAVAAGALPTGPLIEAIGEVVARALGVSRCGFSRVDVPAGRITVLHDYHRDVPSLAGTYPLAGYADYYLEDGRAGRPVQLEDLAVDPRTAAAYAAQYAPIQVRAYLTVPLLRDGQWIANFWASHHEPRRWTEADVALMQATADRVWTILQRKDAEDALQQAKDELEERVQERTAALTQAVATLKRQSEQLQTLTAELALAEQRERQRLAELLHDGLQQLLVGAKFKLNLLPRMDPSRIAAWSREVEQLLDEAVAASRTLTGELSPPILQTAGLIAGLEWLVRWKAERYQLAVALDADPDAVPDSEAMTLLLFQSVRELLFNIVKHAQVQAARVEVRRNDGHLQIVVSDQGVGFDPAVRATTGLGGLGLSSIRQRLEYLGGCVGVQSAPGEGCRITLAVPLRSPANAPATPVTRTPADGRSVPSIGRGAKTRILLVDDHAVVRQALAQMLRAEPDFEVIGEAADGKAAVERAKALSPDVVLMDISMPGMNGIEATEQIRAECPAVQVIGLSMFGAVEQTAAMQQAGAVGYVSKSAPAEELLAAIRACRGRGRVAE